MASEPAPFALPGYVVAALVVRDELGELWRGREAASGQRLLLRRLVVGGPGQRDAVRQLAAVLAGICHPHLIAVHDVVTTPDAVVVVYDDAPGGSLADVLAAYGPLEPGEVVTVGVPIAGALAELHARGLVHGNVSPAAVRFTGDGRPLLADCGLAPLVAGYARDDGDPATAAARDVRALAELCRAAARHGADAEGSRPGALGAVLDEALDDGSTKDAASLATALRAAATPLPVRLPGARPAGGRPAVDVSRLRAGPSGDSPGRARRELPATGQRPGVLRRRAAFAVRVRRATRGFLARRIAAAVAAAAAVLAAAVAGVAWGRATEPTRPVPLAASAPSATPAVARPTPASTPRPSGHASPRSRPTGWTALVAALDRRRDAAFAGAGAPALLDVYAAGSRPLAVEEARLAALRRAGAVARDLRLQLLTVAVVRAGPVAAQLRVVDRLLPYDVVDRAGRVLDHRAGRAPARWLVTLTRTAAGWRITEERAA